jgi:hypothetical protein
MTRACYPPPAMVSRANIGDGAATADDAAVDAFCRSLGDYGGDYGFCRPSRSTGRPRDDGYGSSGRPLSGDRLGRRNGSQRWSGGSAAPLRPADPAQSREWTGTPSGSHGCCEDSSKLSL